MGLNRTGPLLQRAGPMRSDVPPVRLRTGPAVVGADYGGFLWDWRGGRGWRVWGNDPGRRMLGQRVGRWADGWPGDHEIGVPTRGGRRRRLGGSTGSPTRCQWDPMRPEWPGAR